MIRIAGILDVSTIDFPGRLCSVIFLTGCPFRCPYCHNHELINSKGQEKTEREIAEELRRNYLIDGVCITGGEPTMQDITELVKELNFLDVKLDTNGYYPSKLEKLFDYVDYVAIDIKTSPSAYHALTGRKDAWQKVAESLKLISEAGVEWEARTTVVPGMVGKEELEGIVEALKELNVKPHRFVLQQFNNENPLDKTLKAVEKPSVEELKELAKLIPFRTFVRSGEGEFEV